MSCPAGSSNHQETTIIIISVATLANWLASFRSRAAQHVVKRHYDFAFQINLINLTIIPKGFQCQSQACITADAAPKMTVSETQGPTRFYQRDPLVSLLLWDINRLLHTHCFKAKFCQAVPSESTQISHGWLMRGRSHDLSQWLWWWPWCDKDLCV